MSEPKRTEFSELARKAVHVGMGGFALLLGFLTWWQALLLAVAALLHNYYLLPLYGRKRLFRAGGGEGGRDIGILLYPASIAILILVFPRRPEIVAAAWGLLAFGDGLATIAGKALGGPRLPWNPAKTWSGLIAFVAAGFFAARFLYVWTVLARGASVEPGLALTEGWSIGLLAALGATTLLAALLESLPIGVDDNISVPLASGGLLFSFTLFDAAAWDASRSGVLASLPWAVGINALLAAGAYAARSVSLSGVVVGVLMGGSLYAFGGWRAFLMLAAFFVLGSGATKVGFARKASLGIAQERGGRRGARNAVANCGMAALLAYLAATTPVAPLMMLGLVAAFATAACDTVSSEIGQVYGRTPYLITTFRRVPPGTDGAVSVEGTLAGLLAAALLALGAFGLGLVTPSGAGLAVLAAFVGTTVESYLGATFERAKQIDNEAINFVNTLVGALFAIGVALLLPSWPLTPPPTP